MSSPTRVMIIDDDPEFVSLLKFHLSDTTADDYLIDAVNSYDEGMTAIRGGRHDIFLVDYELDQNQTGDQLVEEANKLTRNVIMITAVDDNALGDRIMNAGASDFLNKAQINSQLLNRVVRNALGRRQRLAELLEHQTQRNIELSYDPLTGLLGRYTLREKISEQLANEDSNGALLYLDLDEFKPVNDKYGHEIGDEVLRIIASRLTECLHPRDIIGRIGGDEFVIYLSFDKALDHAPAFAMLVTKKILSSISEPIELPGHRTVTIKASIGITMTPADTADYTELLRYADRAMYGAKRDGKNIYSFHKNTDADEDLGVNFAE